MTNLIQSWRRGRCSGMLASCSERNRSGSRVAQLKITEKIINLMRLELL